MDSRLHQADTYIEQNARSVNPTFRHQYHLMPPVGWMNDPNGFCVFENEYHLFYQFYPYGSAWGPMHWGHAKSKDLIMWEHLPVALAPDQDYDGNGIFSGSALAVDSKLFAYYTGHTDTEIDRQYDEYLRKRLKPLPIEPEQTDRIRQVQCLAISQDGIRFDKFEHNPVVGSEQVPAHARVEDFRDPKVWIHNDKFYMVVGSKRQDFIGQVLFFNSNDGLNWHYLNRLTLDRDFGTVWECPDLFELDGKHVLLISPQHKPRKGCNFENIHSAIALIGQFNYDTGAFSIERIQELDHGFDFYAAQTTVGLDGSRMMVAWMSMWDREYVLDKEKHGWNGSMTLPRKLTLKNDWIYQMPTDALVEYRKNAYTMIQTTITSTWSHPELSGNKMDFELTFDMISSNDFEISFFTGSNDGLILKFNQQENLVSLNRMNSNRPIQSFNSDNDFYRCLMLDCSRTIKLRAILDVSSLELFFNDGQFTMTSLFFPDETSQNVVFRTDGEVFIHDLKKCDM